MEASGKRHAVSKPVPRDVLTLAVLKKPPVFARQANIAHGPQQVNNGGVPNADADPARAENDESGPNGLLEGAPHGERLEPGTTHAAGTGNPGVAVVGICDWPPNRRR